MDFAHQQKFQMILVPNTDIVSLVIIELLYLFVMTLTYLKNLIQF